MLFRIAILVLLSVPVKGLAQVFGGNPANTHWKYQKANHARLIYPVGIDSAANRIAAIINRINALHDSSIGIKRRPVPIVLQPTTTIANGYVSLGPFRSEFFLTPPSNPFQLGALPWTDQLALHEYRHVQQFSNYNIGGARILSILLGQQGQALANALTIPDWFFEGDAVFQETRLSRQGRGRTPYFYNGYRSLWDAGIRYSYMKLRNGSLKDYVPDHYELGYQMVAFGRDRYGSSFWTKVSADAAAMKGLFYPFQKSVKKYTGLSYPEFIAASQVFNRQRLAGNETRPPSRPGRVVDEENPVFTASGQLVYLRTTYQSVPAFYIKNGREEKKIRTRDRSLDHYFSVANNQLVYASFRPHTRWGRVDYSELQLLDLHTGKQSRITRRSKYFSPALSGNADSIVAVEIAASGRQALVILDAGGKLLLTLPNKEGFSFYHPIFWKDKLVAVAKNSMGKLSLLQLEQNGAYSFLLPWTTNLPAYPSVKGDTLFFSMSYQEQDQIFAITGDTHRLFKLQGNDSSHHTGNYQPGAIGNEMVFSRFTAGGYRLNYQKLNQLHWIPISSIATDTASDFGVLSVHQAENSLDDSIRAERSIQGHYRKTTRFFNFHSWQPGYDDPNFTISLIGQNILNTFQSELYARYNRNEGSTQLGYSGIFGGFFPYLKGDLNYTFDRRANYQGETIYWNELQSSMGLAVPLNLSSGRTISFLTMGYDLTYNNSFFSKEMQDKLDVRPYWYGDQDIRFSRQVQQARQEFNPRFAQAIHFNLRHAINHYDSWQLMETGSFYFPGFFPVHSIVLDLAAQQRDAGGGIRFSNDFPFARGYAVENLYRMYKWGINYQLPLLYPDLGVWNIVYLLRVRSNFFFDQAFGKDQQILPEDNYRQFRSAGTEVFFDTKWWNQLPVSFGIRYSRLLDEDVFNGSGYNRWQFILPVNLIPGGVAEKKSLGF